MFLHARKRSDVKPRQFHKSKDRWNNLKCRTIRGAVDDCRWLVVELQDKSSNFAEPELFTVVQNNWSNKIHEIWNYPWSSLFLLKLKGRGQQHLSKSYVTAFPLHGFYQRIIFNKTINI